MFRPTDPQTSLLECQFLVPREKRARLERSWAHAFRLQVLPLIDEEAFRDCFNEEGLGRPNKSIRLLTGVHLLKEWDDLTDAQVLDNLEYNLQWHYALGIESGDAHTCQKMLHNYRVMLTENERARRVFERITERLVEADGLGVGRQRLDSTHAMSNIAVLTRLGLFVTTVTKFLHELKRAAPRKLEALDRGYVKRYLEREGYFADAKREQARRRLPVVARDLLALVRAFEADKEVGEWESYGLMVRLLAEQCEVVEPEEDGGSGGAPLVELTQPDEGKRRPEGDDNEEDGAGSEVTPDADRQREEGGSAEEGESVEADGDDGDIVEPGGNEANADEPDSDGGEANSDEQDAEVTETQEPPLRLKEGKEISGDSLQSPHDPDATYGHKGKGYEVQIAETCEEGNPYQVITGIEVNGANESDQHATVPMAEDLVRRGLGPDELFADTAYGSGENIVGCAEYGVNLQAPVQDPGAPPPVDHWAEPVEASGGAESPPVDEIATATQPIDPTPGEPIDDEAEPMLGLDAFRFNTTYWQVISCPQGHAPIEQEVRDVPVPYRAVFDGDRCAKCPLAQRCPARQLKSGDRVLRWRDAKAATATRQREQQEPAFKERYKIRSGVESTAGEYKGRHGAKKMRVRGGARVRMMAFLKGAALNTKRAVQHHTKQLADLGKPTLVPVGAPA